MRYLAALATVALAFLLATVFLLVYSDTHRSSTPASRERFLPTPTPSEPPATEGPVALPAGTGFIGTAGLVVRSDKFRFHFPVVMKAPQREAHTDAPEQPQDQSRVSDVAVATAILKEMQAAETEQLGLIPIS